jgi:hypothetical protein
VVSDPQIELRVSRLENDTHSIYDLITDIRSTQQEHSQRLAKLETTVAVGFDRVDARFDSIETTLAEVVRRLPEPS